VKKSGKTVIFWQKRRKTIFNFTAWWRYSQFVAFLLRKRLLKNSGGKRENFDKIVSAVTAAKIIFAKVKMKFFFLCSKELF
jgi:hypothetical protein